MEDESLNFVGRVAQKAIIEKEGKVLLMRNRGRETWELPGGRLQVGETPSEGLAREICEEFGVEVLVGQPVATGTFVLSRTGEPHFFVVYACTLRDPSVAFTLAEDEVEEVRWVARDELATLNIWEVYRQALEVFFRTR